MISLKEIKIDDINEFWDEHFKYLIDDEMIESEEDKKYFSGNEYRGLLESHMIREKDKQHMLYFLNDGVKIGLVSYCTYQSEDGKCFILDYWLYPEFRKNGLGHICFNELEKYTKNDGAKYYMLNSEKKNSIRFWKSLGFVENGFDEYNMPLFIRK